MRALAVAVCLVLLAGIPTFAQWTDNSNLFYDSLHMSACNNYAGTKVHMFIVKSEDGGYFILWEDNRNSGTQKTDIYVQKYDKDGNQLWNPAGLPVASSTLDERFDFSPLPVNGSYAAADGAGGLYVCWNYRTTITPYVYNGVAAQHMHADGSRVFGDAGYNLGKPDAATQVECLGQQMVPDGNNGFFIAYERHLIGAVGPFANYIDLVAYCYKDEGGTLKLYGGGQMDEYGKQQITGSRCGTRFVVDSGKDANADARIESYTIYPDRQGGCNVVMAVSFDSEQQYFVGYNRLCRVKKDCHTTVIRHASGGEGPDGTAVTKRDYQKDSVLRLYTLKTYFYTLTCPQNNNPGDLAVDTNTKIENNGNGFLILSKDSNAYINTPLGAVLSTGGNINAELIAVNEGPITITQGPSGGPTHVHGYSLSNEIYDSIPYQLCSDLTHPDEAYRPIPPDNAQPLDTLLAGPDSLIYQPIQMGGLSTLAGSGNKVWLAGRATSPVGANNIYLQELKLVSSGTKKYTFSVNTSAKAGLRIGKELLGNGSSTQISYNNPGIAADSNGHALFYIQEVTRYVRVSPIMDGGVLSWGAMGTPVGSPSIIGNPSAVLSDDGKGLLAWEAPLLVLMQRLSDVSTPGYQPPLHPTRLLNTTINDAISTFIGGTTNVWTTIQQPITIKLQDGSFGGFGATTPVLSILDNSTLGDVYPYVYENNSALRVTNGLPYLDRNFTIAAGNGSPGAPNINLRFYFTRSQFDSLKTADPSIVNPGYLGLIRQSIDPNFTTTLPQVYTPVAGEELVPITAWDSTEGGYYIELSVNQFGNFFIVKGAVPLPLKWLDVQGKLNAPTEAAITWTVTEEQHVKGYTVQYSADGVKFIDGCTTGSANSGTTMTYSCTVALQGEGSYLFRVKQEDIDGNSSYSKIVMLKPDVAGQFTVRPNPVSSAAVLQIPEGAVVKKLTLLNVDGKAVWQTTGALNGSLTIPMRQLAAGIYYLQVIQDKDTQTLKIIRE